jgi:hypothetical protein
MPVWVRVAFTQSEGRRAHEASTCPPDPATRPPPGADQASSTAKSRPGV